MSYVIGTAGHVDHGKSSLVRALTGIDPDRLAEEKAREMTIDLGFAWLALPTGETVGIVDVPGHRDFIENMLAGVGGIDLALFVVAADEGIMPQTSEHLAILDLLDIPGGVVALTKIDMISDPEWIDLVTLDLIDAFSGTVLESAPIVPVSARTGAGLDQLVATLGDVLLHSRPQPDLGKPRLPVDRVFTISGFGTVVTGTLTGGSLTIGSEVEIQPSGKHARIRGLQSHKSAVSEVNAGSRAAVNLSGISTDSIRRGDVITIPGILTPTTLIDVSFRHLTSASRPLKHNVEVKFFSGAAETIAHVRLLGDRELAIGQQGWLQLRLESPQAVDRGDRFILRYPSPTETIGGGIILDAHPEHRWRRFKPDVIARLETLAAGRSEDVVLQMLESQIALNPSQAEEISGLSTDAFNEAIALLIDRGDVLHIDNLLIARSSWERLTDRMKKEVHAYHTQFPLRLGMPKEAFRNKLGLDSKIATRLIPFAIESGVISENAAQVCLPYHIVRFTAREQASIDQLLQSIQQNPAAPPSVKEAAGMVGDEVLRALIDRGNIMQLNEDVLIGTDIYHLWVLEIQRFIAQTGSITVAQARDLLGSSRKYVLALLEHLDESGITKRAGDERILSS